MSAFRPPEKPKGLEARGLNWRRRAKHWVAYWVARADLVDKGYSLESQRLWPPTDDTAPTVPTVAEWNYIASECERLQDEMLVWSKGETAKNPTLLFDDTITALIRIYQIDPDSRYHGVRHITRLGYDSRLRILTRAVGKARLSLLSFRDFKRWHEGFRGDIKDATGRTVELGAMTPRAHGLMNMLRDVIAFGALAELPHCVRLKAILSDMEFPNAKPRTDFITARQCVAIRRQAHVMGHPSIALQQAVAYELGMRPKDTIGEWLPVSEPGMSSIIYAGKKWMLGIDWREIDSNMILRHRLSKSIRGRNAVADPGAGKVEEYDLKEYPMVMEELAHIPADKRTGPLIINGNTDRPWNSARFAKAWRLVARAAGVPDHIQNRDNRAGSATEADASTEDVAEVQNHLAHDRPTTTQRYIRERRTKRTKLQRARVANRKVNDEGS